MMKIEAPDDFDLSVLDTNLGLEDIEALEFSEIESKEPPPGLFPLKKNHFLQQFHEAKAKDKNKRRGVKRYIKPENAKQVLAYLPETGDTTHAVVRGDFVVGDMIPVILKGKPASLVQITTLGMSEGNAKMLAELKAKGLIQDLKIMVSHYFASVDAESTFARVCQILGHPPTITRNHTKVILIAQDPDYFVIAGSANLRSSDNVEQFAIWNDQQVFDFHRTWIDELAEHYSKEHKESFKGGVRGRGFPDLH